jgi:hypothetical protein
VAANPDREQALLALARVQLSYQAAMMALTQAGDRPPNEAYERFLTAARQFLSATAEYGTYWPGSFSVQVAAIPLVQQLSIFADHLQADDDREQSQRCRDEADELARRFLDRVAGAAVMRDRAKEAARAGRFHEALTRLEEIARRVHRPVGRTVRPGRTSPAAFP